MVGLRKLSHSQKWLQTPLEGLLKLAALFAVAVVVGWLMLAVCLLLPGDVLLLASVSALVLSVLLLISPKR